MRVSSSLFSAPSGDCLEAPVATMSPKMLGNFLFPMAAARGRFESKEEETTAGSPLPGAVVEDMELGFWSRLIKRKGSSKIGRETKEVMVFLYFNKHEADLVCSSPTF